MAEMRVTKRLILILTVILITVVGLSACWYFFIYRNPTRIAQRDIEGTIEAVGKLYELPNEMPVHATVTDKALLASQPFFALAENGDKVLIYNTAKKVILYRPSTGKIINVTNINPTDVQVEAQLPSQATSGLTATPVPAPSAEPEAPASTKPVTITINNGTAIAGLTQKVQQQLLAESVSGEVISRGNAAVRDYARTLVIPLTPVGEVATAELVSVLNAQRGELPAGETAPSTDVLIIVGNDVATTQ